MTRETRTSGSKYDDSRRSDDFNSGDAGLQRKPSAVARRQQSRVGSSRGTLDLVRELAVVRDTNPVMYPAAFARLKVTVPDLDNLIKIYPPEAPPSTSGDGVSNFLGGSSGFNGRSPTASFLSSPTRSSSGGGAAATAAGQYALGFSGTTPRTGGASSSSRAQRRRDPFTNSAVMSGDGSGIGSGVNDSLDVSAISGIERYDDEDEDEKSNNESLGDSNNSYPSVGPDDVLLRARNATISATAPHAIVGGTAVQNTGSSSNSHSGAGTSGGSGASRGRTSAADSGGAMGTYRGSDSTVDARRAGGDAYSRDTFGGSSCRIPDTTSSGRAAETKIIRDRGGGANSTDTYGTGPGAAVLSRSLSSSYPERRTGRTTKTAVTTESSASAAITPASVSLQGGNGVRNRRGGGGEHTAGTEVSSRPQPSRATGNVASGAALGRRPYWEASVDDRGGVRKSEDYGTLGSAVKNGDGRAARGRDAGLGLDDSQTSGDIQKLLSVLPSRPPEGVDVGGQPLDVKDERCVCLHQPMIMRGIQGKYLRTRIDECDEDAEDIDDSASTITVATATSAAAAGGGWSSAGGLNAAPWSSSPDIAASVEGALSTRFGGGGGGSGSAGEAAAGEGDRKTMFLVDGKGTGARDTAEVVHFVSATRRHDQGPLVYGDTVGIRSAFGKGKYLRPTASGSVVFARSQAGKTEKWRVLPYEPPGSPSLEYRGGGGRGGHGKGEKGSLGGAGGRLKGGRRGRGRMGTFVRKGDRVELENLGPNGKTLLVLRRRDFAVDEWEVGSARRGDYRGEEYEAWEIMPAGVPYLPAWRRERPYLTGDFLLDREPFVPSRTVTNIFGLGKVDTCSGDSGADRAGLHEGGAATGGTGGGGRRGAADATEGGGGLHDEHEGPLGELPEAVQEQLLLDDLLSALMGFAGSYIAVRVSPEREEACGTCSNVMDLEFAVEHKGIDESLAYLAQRVLPLGTSYVRVKRFASERGQYEYGKVAHALSAGIRRLLREYLVLIAQLEHQLLQGKLSLQRLWFYVQPSLRTMETLESLTVELREVKGGELLRRLKALAGSGGDAASRQLHTFLLHEASVPYLEMLETWMYHGKLNDQYGEFMIGQIEDVKKQDVGEDFNTRYWSGRYLLRASHVIGSLAGREHKILTTGKYLNVVRECGQRVTCPSAGPIPADPGTAGEGLYARVIDVAYGFASRCLMDLVVKEGQLFPRLESIKHYFLLDRGDFFEQFLDCADEELDKLVPEISVPRVESLLHLSVQMSSASHDPFKDDLGLEFSGDNLLKHLENIHGRGGPVNPTGSLGRRRSRTMSLGGSGSTPQPTRHAASDEGSGGHYAQRMIQGTAELRGVEGLMMSYKVSWPVSLVLSKKSLTKYQLLFRHIFFAKHVQRMLSRSWRDHQDTKQLELKGLMMASYNLRQRMLHFMQNLVYYMMVEVIEPNWHQFMDDLRRLCADRRDDGVTGEGAGVRGGGGGGGGAGTLDDVLSRHDQFQDLCLKECLLTNLALLTSLTKVMISCLHFGDQGALFAEERRKQEEAASSVAKQGGSGDMSEITEALTGAGGRGVRDGLGAPKGLTGGARTKYLQRRSSSMRMGLDTAKYREYIQQSQEDFDASLHVFAGQLWRDASAHYHSHLNNLCARLDYNGFFTQTYIGGRNAGRSAV